jgi:hypothetical protein
MRRTVLTDDFEAGFVSGYMRKGLDGLREFLAARVGFVDEQHDVDEVLDRQDLPDGEVRIQTRLESSLRQPPGDELFTQSRDPHCQRARRPCTSPARIARSSPSTARCLPSELPAGPRPRLSFMAADSA